MVVDRNREKRVTFADGCRTMLTVKKRVYQTWYVPRQTADAVRAMATEIQVSPSQLVSLFLGYCLVEVKEGRLPIQCVPTRYEARIVPQAHAADGNG